MHTFEDGSSVKFSLNYPIFEHGTTFLPGPPTDTHSNKAIHKAESNQTGGRNLGKFKEKEVRVCHPQKMLNSKKEH